MLELQHAGGIGQLGHIKWQLALCLLVVYLICYFSLWKGISTSGKVEEDFRIICSCLIIIRYRSYVRIYDGNPACLFCSHTKNNFVVVHPSIHSSITPWAQRP